MKIPDIFYKTLAAKIVAGAVTVLTAAISVGWLWVWGHFNPEFDYQVQPSSLSSHFVSLSQILDQIEKDSRVYCTGGWEQRLARLGLRRCYHFVFLPSSVYRITICAADDRTAQITTADELTAIRFFQQRYAPLECFLITQNGGKHDYEIRPGKDAHLRSWRFATDAPQDVEFCGCSPDQESTIARVIGATLEPTP